MQLLVSWLRSPSRHCANDGVMADRCLHEMKEMAESQRLQCFPNLYTYATVIEAHAKANSPNASQRSIELLDEPKEVAKAGTEPNFFVYAHVLQAILRSAGGDSSKDGEVELRQKIHHLFAELLPKRRPFGKEVIQILKRRCFGVELGMISL